MMSKILKKTISILLVLVTIFTLAATPAAAKKSEQKPLDVIVNPVEQYEYRYHNGYNSPSLMFLIRPFETINKITTVLMGRGIFDDEKLVFTAEGFIDDIFNEMAEVTFFDGYELFNSLAFPNQSSQAIIDLFNIDIEDTCEQIHLKILDKYHNDEPLKGIFLQLILIYLRQVKEIHVYEVPVSDTLYRLNADIVYTYGGTDLMELDFYYDTEKQLLYNSTDKGLLKLGFNFDLSNYTLYSTVNSWQSKFGFCLAYDFIANIVIMDYNTERVKFTYDNREWMFQFWKGRYFIAPGGELGIYNRPVGSKGSFYNCATEDLMNMSIEVYHEDELLFKEGPMMHWWITGFHIGQKFYLPESLTMKGTIEFPTEEMATLFTQAAASHKRLTIEQDGNMISYTFGSYINL